VVWKPGSWDTSVHRLYAPRFKGLAREAKKCTRFYIWMFRVLCTVGSLVLVQRLCAWLLMNFKFQKSDVIPMFMRVGFYALRLKKWTAQHFLGVGFYASKHLYACIPIFLCTRPYVSMLEYLSILVTLCFYAHVKL
jgi:hypothetical protein